MTILRILFLVSICWCGTIQAQEKSNSFRLELSSNSIFIQGDQPKISNYGWNYYVSKRKYNYSLQLSAFGQLNRRLELGLGLAYANLDAYTTHTCEYCLVPAPNKDLFPSGGGLFTKFRAVEMPLELRINWFKTERKIAPYAAVGMTGRMYLLYSDDLGRGPQIAEGNDFSLGLRVGVGSRFSLTQKWSLNVGAHLMGSRYDEGAYRNGNFPNSNARLKWLGEWSASVGVSRAFF